MKCSLLTLSGYLDDELDAGRRAEVDAHLVGCERCRKGLDCLREETDRFRGLGKVHVPDRAIHSFLEQLGLIGPDELLPQRSPPVPSAVSRDAPPWVGGGDAGAALPWVARRDGGDPTGGDQPSLPFTDSLSPGVTLTPPAPPPPPHPESELHLNGRSTASPPAMVPPAPPGPAPVPPLSPISAVPPGPVPDVPSAPTPARSSGPAPTASPAPVSAPSFWPAPTGPTAPMSEVLPQHLPPGPPTSEPSASSPADSGPPGPTPARSGSVVLEGVAAWPAGLAHVPVPVSEQSAAATRGRSSEQDAPASPPPTSDAGAEKPAGPAPRLTLPATPLPLSPPPPATPLPGSPPPRPAVVPLPSIPPLPPAGAMWPARPAPTPPRADDDEDPWSWAPMDGDPIAPAAADVPRVPSVEGGSHPVSTSGSHSTPDRDRAGMKGDDHESQDVDTTPDPLIDPLIARVARPPQMIHTTLISRLRDQVALRLALTRGADATEPNERSPRPTPAGGRSQPFESVGPLVAANRSRVAGPGERGGETATAAWEMPPPERAESRHWADTPYRTPTIAEELPRSVVYPLGNGLPRKPGRHTRRLGNGTGGLGVAGGSVAQLAQRFGDLPHQVRRFASQPRRRWLAVAILAVVVVIGSLVITHLGPGSSGAHAAAVATLPRASTGAAPLTQPTSSAQPSASVAPTATPAPSATATPVPTPVPTAVPPTQIFGSGGSGWALEDIRYGTQPDGELWVVVDFNGGSGQPTAAAAFSNPTTLLVTLTGVSASSFTPSTDGIVTGASVATSGTHVILSFDLSHAEPLKGGYYSAGADSESSAPLHLILELG